MTQIGRPSSAAHPTVTVRHVDTGQVLAWSEGSFSGDGGLGEVARRIHLAGEPVRIDREMLPMTDGPQGAAAAMLAACKGRGMLVSGLDALENGFEAGESMPEQESH